MAKNDKKRVTEMLLVVKLENSTYIRLNFINFLLNLNYERLKK
jgi:hypothetical protein